MVAQLNWNRNKWTIRYDWWYRYQAKFWFYEKVWDPWPGTIGKCLNPWLQVTNQSAPSNPTTVFTGEKINLVKSQEL